MNQPTSHRTPRLLCYCRGIHFLPIHAAAQPPGAARAKPGYAIGGDSTAEGMPPGGSSSFLGFLAARTVYGGNGSQPEGDSLLCLYELYPFHDVPEFCGYSAAPTAEAHAEPASHPRADASTLYPLTKAEQELIQRYRSAPPAFQAAVRKLLDLA